MRLGGLLLKRLQHSKRSLRGGVIGGSRYAKPGKKRVNKPKPTASQRGRLSTVVVAEVPSLARSEATRAQETTALKSSALIRPNPQFRRSIEAFLLDQRSEHTRRAYGKDLKRFVKFLLGRELENKVDAIDRSTVIAYKDYLLGEGLQHTTIDRQLATLRSFFRWLVDDGVILKSPAESVRFLNPKRESRTIGFTNEEVSAVLKLPNLFTKTGSLHYAVLMVLFYCGLRRSELCSIRTSHLGTERGHHYVRLQGKGNAERIVVMVKPVWNAIQHYLKMMRKNPSIDQPLFTPIRNNRTLTRDKPLDPSMIYYIVTRYAREAGIKSRVSPHSCRATAISNARDHNIADRAIQEFAGWSTTTMITRYDKRKTALEKSAAHAIDYGDADRAIPVTKSESEI